jgi:type II secretory pathway pseudopilin PulG
MGWVLLIVALAAVALLYMRWARRKAERERAAQERAAALMAEVKAAAQRKPKAQDTSGPD